MNALKSIPLFVLLTLSGAAVAQEETQTTGTQAQTQTLLIQRVAHEDKNAWPTRGQTMAEVETKFGAPNQKLAPIGGQKRQWPAIHRWVYPECTVYFEKNRVIDVVANKASAEEIGPKPPIK